MREQAFLLIELQKIDSEINILKDKKINLPQEEQALLDSLDQLEQEVHQAQSMVDEIYAAHRQKEAELKRGIEGLKKTQERLLEVKTNKEYQAMLKEIEIIGQKNSMIEDQIILKLEEIDTARETLTKKQQSFSQRRAGHEGKIKKIQNELLSLDKTLLQTEHNQKSIREKINPDILRKYDMIKKRRNGRAVVPAWKEVCGGCHMNIPPQMYNELQKSSDIMICPNCNRIMYWENREQANG